MLHAVMQAGKSSPPSNPFRFGALALDEAFADRESELRDLKADVRNGQDVVIFAPRRYGKSSLVWRAMQELARSRVLVAYVNLMTAPTKVKLAEKLAGAIYEGIASPLTRARDRAVAPFRGLRISPSINLDADDGSLSFSFAVGRGPDDVDATIERLLELPAELAAERGRRVALIFDEFQEVAGIDPALPKLMRTVFEQQPEVARVYLGSRRHMMERLFNDENEPFWRSAKRVELGVIDPELFRPFIAARFKATRKGVDAEALDLVAAATGGHPYATQELCYALWEQTPFDDVATVAHFEAALEAVLRSEHAHFSLRWEEASSVQRLVLGALAAEPGRPLAGEYRTRHGLPSASSVQTALRALGERELISRRADGEYELAEPFLAGWIAGNVRSDA
jgi:AAA+ ATPase superfamily predicted ATPase